MSDGRISRDIDPRFDPRFQRGYVPDVAAPMSEPVAPSPPRRPVAAPAAGADDVADPAPAILGLLAHAQAERPARSDRESVDGDPTDGEQAERDSPAFDRAVEAQQAAADVSTRWFWIALGACLVFIVVGVALFWNGASDRSMFRGASSGLEGAFYQFSMALAPGLVQAGVIGVVAVLVMWAITGRRSRRGVE